MTRLSPSNILLMIEAVKNSQKSVKEKIEIIIHLRKKLREAVDDKKRQ